MKNIPQEMYGSPALQLIQSQGWNFTISNPPNVELEICPYCKKTGGGHCYVECRSPDDPQFKRDGLHTCHKCDKGGSLYTLKQHLGLIIPGVTSRSDWAASEKQIEPMPDIEALHQNLLEDADALDYLINERKLSREIICKQKLGVVNKRYFKSCGEVKCISFPYLVGNNPIFVHFRTLPPAGKDFNSLRGWDSTLYNGQIIKAGLKEITLFEGEFDTLTALDNGIEAAGVPGANFKKADWIKTIEDLEIEKVFVCYDSDKVGTRAAQNLATRIGIQKCYKITLPKGFKDINEWFQNGGTKEQFEELKQIAPLFDVAGVISTKDVLQEFEDELNEKGVAPRYSTGWTSLNKYVGFDTGDVIDLIAPGKVGKSTFALNLLEHMVETYNENAIFICLEMTQTKLARKWISMLGGIQDNIPKTPEDANSLKEQFLNVIPYVKQKAANREGELLLCYPKFKHMDELYKLIVDVIRRYGTQWVVFDNVQRAADLTVGGKNRTQHLSEISKNLSQIAKDYNIQMVRIIQPHAIKPGALTKSTDADGSSQLSKDCDCSLTLDRDKINEISANDFNTMGYVESDSAFGDKMLVNVDLSRYSSGGYTTLKFDGARSTVYDYDAIEIAKVKAELNNVGHEATYKRLTSDIAI